MRPFFLLAFIFLLNIYNVQSQTVQSLAGEYYLQGVMETASGILLNPDGSFEFFYSYGAVDREGKGTWRHDSIDSNKIILNSRPRPPKDFALLDSGHSMGPVSIIQISHQNTMLLSYMYIRAHTAQGSVEKRADSHGTFTMAKQPVQKIEILFELCPERFSSFEVADRTLNHFEFGLEPWIAEVFFDHMDFEITATGLKGGHPLLKSGLYNYQKSKQRHAEQ
jgi:hypothetical protein